MQFPSSRRRLSDCLASLFLFLGMLLNPVQALGQEKTQETPPPEPPKIAAASDEAENAMQVFQLPDGVTASVFAAEPDVGNPVAIDVDFQNRVWVCESFRQERGIEDNRNHPEWLNEDLAAQSVADRLAYIKKHLGDDAINYTKQDDRIRVLIDTNHDGKADSSTVFANRFNAIESGTGAGVLSYRGDVFYTCIPDLWKLNDTNNDGVADSRESLHSGFGIRFAFRGHDLHGLIIGPDGRLYFSVGDRGYHVNDRISDPSSGAVFRCELDGSNLEVIHTGLRNPQELVFDNYGNLFTGDNNSDSGPLLFHAGVMALVHNTRLHGSALLMEVSRFPDPHVRMAAVVAGRKLHQSGYSTADLMRERLAFSEPEIVLEMARAIHDLPITEVLPDLAALKIESGIDDALARRVLNANFRVGTAEAVQRMKEFVLNESLSVARGIDAVQMLAEWNEPPNLDKVLGNWRPLDKTKRSDKSADAIAALFEVYNSLPGAIGTELVGAATNLKVRSALPVLSRTFREDTDANRRLKALEGLLVFGGDDLQPVIDEAMVADVPELRIAALNHTAKSDFERVKDTIASALKSDSTPERQNAIALVGESELTLAAELLMGMLNDFANVPADSQLDVLLAAKSSKNDICKAKFLQMTAEAEKASPNFMYSLTREGGNADRGSKIFFERTDVSCLRCHKIQGSGGDVGPNLSDIGITKDRDYLLESLIEPSKTITENFETVVVLDANGKTHIGVTKASTDEVLSIMNADAIMVNIPVADIEDIRRGDSAMPDDVTKHLTLRELRDLMEFLATQDKPDATVKNSKVESSD